MLIGSLYFDRGPIAKFMGSPVARWLGEISLSIYLVHAPLFHILIHARPILAHHMNDDLASAATTIFMLTCLLIISTYTHRFIEKPGQTLGRRFLSHRKQLRTTAIEANIKNEQPSVT
jgi:peptidoglycan/LPS O-acetylase OafA/YrhL